MAALGSTPGRSIAAFKGALIGGGARPNLFKVQMTDVPGDGNWDATNFEFLCKAASLPASNVPAIDVPFRGRIFKVAGDRSIENWTVTIINDEDNKYRTAFEEWLQLIHKLENGTGATSPDEYMKTAQVFQLGRGSDSPSKKPNDGTYANSADNTGNVAILKAYDFQDIFPVSVSAIDLSYDSGDTIEEFTVEFAVNSFSLSATIDNPGGAGG